MTSESAEGEGSPRLWRSVVFVWLLVSAILIAVSWQAISAFRFPDPDDQLRLVEVRDWIAGQSWFDVRQYRMNPPEGAPMHWSRLVDVPLAIVTVSLTPLLGQATAELIAAIAIPLLTLLLVLWLVARVTNRLFGPGVALWAVLVTPMAVPVLHQLRPMRIDHHGWQLVLAMAALATTLSSHTRRGTWICGGALALWLNISIEGLPIAAGFMALLALRWITDTDNRIQLVRAMCALAAGSAALLALTRPAAEIMASYCDAISWTHVSLFIAGAALLALLAWWNPHSRLVLLGTMAAIGATAIATVFLAAPQCASGAFAELDPLVRTVWYDNVLEGRPVWFQSPGMIAHILVPPLLAAIAAWMLWTRRGVDRGQLLALLFLSAIAFAQSLLVTRSAAFASLFAIPFVAWLLSQWLAWARGRPSAPARIAATAAIALALIPGQITDLVWKLVVSDAPANAAVAAHSAMQCESPGRFAALARLPTGNVLAPIDTGPAILLGTKHSIIASGHHRNDEAMHDIIVAFSGEPDKVRRIFARRDIDYVVACPGTYEAQLYAARNPDGLMAGILSGTPSAHLRRVGKQEDDGPVVFRVRVSR